jgi:hypothetical protein
MHADPLFSVCPVLSGSDHRDGYLRFARDAVKFFRMVNGHDPIDSDYFRAA